MKSFSHRVTSGRQTERPRVLLLVSRDQRRGPESFAVALAGQLRDRGHQVRVRSLAPSDGSPGVGAAPLGARPLGVTTLLRLRSELADTDVVVACGSKTLPACALATVARPRPFVYQNIGHPLYWARGPFRRAWVRLLLRRASGVAALTEGSAEILRTTFGVPAARLQVIRNARDTSVFSPATADERLRARARMVGDLPGPVVALVGALAPEKRVDVAIEAIARTRTGARLVVVGAGPLEAALRAQADAVAPGRVHFLGAGVVMPPVYHGSDAVVLSSASEGVPGVLVEAALSGLPVVSTDVGFVRDVVVPGETGLLVPPGDPAALAAALDDVLARADALGVAARRRAVDRFALDRAADAWAALISSLVGQGGRDVATAH